FFYTYFFFSSRRRHTRSKRDWSSDVCSSDLALGARAVMLGRAYLWGLGANGQAGVENVLDIMRSGLDSSLIGLGKSSIDELKPDDYHIPEGFIRRLGE